MAMSGILEREVSVSERAGTRAGQMQTPPPEEASAAPAPPMHETQRAAYRLAMAYRRSSRSRDVQNHGMASYIGDTIGELKPIYLDVARWAIRQDIHNFEGYVTSQFAYTKQGVVGDDTLHDAVNMGGAYKTKAALQRYHVYSRHTPRAMKQELESGSEHFKARALAATYAFPEYTDKQKWNFVLMNNFSDLTALFRYCIAVGEGLQAPQDEFHLAALQQLLTDPINYTAAWGGAIPASLKKQAEDIILIKL